MTASSWSGSAMHLLTVRGTDLATIRAMDQQLCNWGEGLRANVDGSEAAIQK